MLFRSAQELSIRQLVKRQTAITKSIGKEMSRQLKDVDPEFLVDQQESDKTQKMATPRRISPQSLKGQILFDDITVAADVTKGRVPIDVSGVFNWDGGHGFELTILGGKVVEKSEISPFPCQIPAKIDLNGIPADNRGMRRAELKIHGIWSGIYEIDAGRNCTGIWWKCPACRYVAWDPNGMTLARRVPRLHHFMAVAIPCASVFAILTAVVLSPVLLLSSLMVWPGWFWGSLALCSASLLFLVATDLLQSHPVVWLNVAQAGLASAGLFAWYQYDAFASVSVLGLIGWLLWGCSLLMLLYSLSVSVLVVIKFHAEDSVAGWAIASPFLAFTGVVGAALWFTAHGEYSKLHLIWIVLLTFIIGRFVFVLMAKRVAKLLVTEAVALERELDRLDHDS